jgi:hypothetical protein
MHRWGHKSGGTVAAASKKTAGFVITKPLLPSSASSASIISHEEDGTRFASLWYPNASHTALNWSRKSVDEDAQPSVPTYKKVGFPSRVGHFSFSEVN